MQEDLSQLQPKDSVWYLVHSLTHSPFWSGRFFNHKTEDIYKAYMEKVDYLYLELHTYKPWFRACKMNTENNHHHAGYMDMNSAGHFWYSNLFSRIFSVVLVYQKLTAM